MSRAAVLVGGFTMVALALRLALVRDSLFGDELFMFRIVHDRSVGDVLRLVHHTEKTPPLFFLLVWASAKLGDPTVWLRAPSIVFGTALVPLGYLLGFRVAGRTAGLLTSAMLALMPFAISYGADGRAYSALAFFAALSTLCLLRALDTKRLPWWVGYALAVLAVLYTHYMGVFVLVVQAAWAAWTHRERLRELIAVHALIALGYVPWIPFYVLQQAHSAKEARGIATLAPPTVERFARVNVIALLGHPYVNLSDVPGRLGVIVGLSLVAIAAIVAAGRAWLRRSTRAHLSSPLALVALLAVATPAGVGIISLRPHMSFMLPRNLSASLVMTAVLVGWLLLSLGRRASIVAVTALLAVLVTGAVRTLETANRRPPFLAVAHYIDAHAQPRDAVIQYSFLPPTGAPDDVLLINFKRPHALFRSGPGFAQAWELGRRGAHLFIVVPLPGPLRKVKHLPVQNGPRKEFVRLAERRYVGFWNILVGDYVLRPGVGHG